MRLRKVIEVRTVDGFSHYELLKPIKDVPAETPSIHYFQIGRKYSPQGIATVYRQVKFQQLDFNLVYSPNILENKIYYLSREFYGPHRSLRIKLLDKFFKLFKK